VQWRILSSLETVERYPVPAIRTCTIELSLHASDRRKKSEVADGGGTKVVRIAEDCRTFTAPTRKSQVTSV
jgi:hypothetical protein